MPTNSWRSARPCALVAAIVFLVLFALENQFSTSTINSSVAASLRATDNTPTRQTPRTQWLGATPARAECTIEEAATQAARFKKVYHNGQLVSSACSAALWMRVLAEEDHTRATPPHRVVLNIGANKGYLATSLLGHWTPSMNATPQHRVSGQAPRACWLRHEIGIAHKMRHVPRLQGVGGRSSVHHGGQHDGVRHRAAT